MKMKKLQIELQSLEYYETKIKLNFDKIENRNHKLVKSLSNIQNCGRKRGAGWGVGDWQRSRSREKKQSKIKAGVAESEFGSI